MKSNEPEYVYNIIMIYFYIPQVIAVYVVL